MEYPLRPVEKVFPYKCQFRPGDNGPVFLGAVAAAAGEEVLHFLLAIDYLSNIKGIGKDTGDGILAPSAAPFGLYPHTVQFAGNPVGPHMFPGIPVKNLAHHPGFVFIDM